MASFFDPRRLGMGIGWGGIGDANVVFKRKFRWTMEVIGNGCKVYIPPMFVTVAARPHVTFEEVEVNFLNKKTFWAGKPTWEPITVTYLDTAGGWYNTTTWGILAWLSAVYDFNDPLRRERQSTKRWNYIANVKLTMYDGCGKQMEEWILKDAWPAAANFGDVDYSVSDVANIELTLRYSDVLYSATCGLRGLGCLCGECEDPSATPQVQNV